MKRVIAILHEAYGLVVDDASLAVAILVWTAAVWLSARSFPLPPTWGALVFLAGLVAILVENVARRARQP